MLNAIYDTGMYMRFFIHGPKYMKQVLELDPETSFASIQMRLFMKYCAKSEI